MSFDWHNPYPTVRTPVFARNVVSTSHPLASQAGLRMLIKGGNAIDAAIAAAAALTIVEPVSNGLGSDLFAILWDGERLQGLNASGVAPAALDPAYFERRHAHHLDVRERELRVPRFGGDPDRHGRPDRARGAAADGDTSGSRVGARVTGYRTDARLAIPNVREADHDRRPGLARRGRDRDAGRDDR